MNINQVKIEDTFAEGFNMVAARLIVTAESEHWANIAASCAVGYGTSIIGCDAEAGIESPIPSDNTPDRRPGVAMLFFARNAQKLTEAVINRASQCLATCPTTAIFDGRAINDDHNQTQTIPLGSAISRFGDSYQRKIEKFGRCMWQIPATEGDMLIEAETFACQAVAGGNLYIAAADQPAALTSATAAADAVRSIPNVITPFPGGIVRCASKAGSQYAGQIASTNEAYCPTLRGKVQTHLPDHIHCVYEIVIDGLTCHDVLSAMQTAILAACHANPKPDLITAGNFGGRLGPHRFNLHTILASAADNT